MGLPRVLGKTRSLSCHPSPLASLSSFCRALCAPSAASARVVSLRVRLLLRFFGVLNVPSTSRERFTESVPASRYMSDHLRPRTSPRLSPVHTATTYKASSRYPRAAPSNALTSSGSTPAILWRLPEASQEALRRPWGY